MCWYVICVCLSVAYNPCYKQGKMCGMQAVLYSISCLITSATSSWYSLSASFNYNNCTELYVAFGICPVCSQHHYCCCSSVTLSNKFNFSLVDISSGSSFKVFVKIVFKYLDFFFLCRCVQELRRLAKGKRRGQWPEHGHNGVHLNYKVRDWRTSARKLENLLEK